MRKNILIRQARLFDASAGSFSEPRDLLVTDGVISRICDNIPVLPEY